MAAPTYVAAGAVASGTGALTVGIPTGWAQNDLFLLYVQTSNQAVSTPTGWTEAPSSPQGVGTAATAFATRLTVFYKIAGSSESSVSVADSGDHQIARMIAIRGVDTSNPFNASNGDVLVGESNAVTIPAVTTTVADCMIVASVANGTDSGTPQTSGWFNPNLTNIVERMDVNTSQGTGGGFGVMTGIKAVAGNTGTTAAGIILSSQARHILAVKPGAAILTLAANTGTYTLSGVNASLERNRIMPASGGAYTLTGNDVGLNKRRAMTADTGSYALTGVNAGLRASRHLAASAGTYTITGVSVGLRAARRVTAATGEYLLTGIDAVLTYIPIAAAAAEFNRRIAMLLGRR